MQNSSEDTRETLGDLSPFRMVGDLVGVGNGAVASCHLISTSILIDVYMQPR